MARHVGNGATSDAARVESLGRAMATVLAGAWRRSPPPLEVSAADLQQITLGLLRAKSGALAWWRVRNSAVRDSPAAEELRTAYHHHGISAALHARSLTRVVTRLREGGVEPVLVKGPSIARLYPERGLRPFEDLDLCVRPDQHAAANAILKSWVGEHTAVDVQAGFDDLSTQRWEDVYGRTQLATFGSVDVRVLAPEDHLRLLCFHQFRHGLPTPLWLCDIAVAVETRPATFDWNLVLGGNRRRADWVACGIGLAHQLLGAAVDDTPVATRARQLPGWLAPSVLAGWGRWCRADFRGPELFPDIGDLVTSGAQSIRRYWPSPVAATVHLRMPFSNFPRMPLQIVDAVWRLGRFSLRRLLGLRPDPPHH